MLYIVILLVGGVCSYFGPWWTIAPVCFVFCFLLPRKPVSAFWVAAFAGMTLWGGFSLYLHLGSETAISAKVAGIFTAGLPALADMPAIALILIVVACIVGPVSGFSGLAGMKLRQLIHPPRG